MIEECLNPFPFFDFVCVAVASVLHEESPTAVLAFVGVDGRIAIEAEWRVVPANHKPVLTALGAPTGAPELFRYVAFFPLQSGHFVRSHSWKRDSAKLQRSS